jgi:hypothetical protein
VDELTILRGEILVLHVTGNGGALPCDDDGHLSKRAGRLRVGKARRACERNGKPALVARSERPLGRPGAKRLFDANPAVAAGRRTGPSPPMNATARC